MAYTTNVHVAGPTPRVFDVLVCTADTEDVDSQWLPLAEARTMLAAAPTEQAVPADDKSAASSSVVSKDEDAPMADPASLPIEEDAAPKETELQQTDHPEYAKWQSKLERRQQALQDAETALAAAKAVNPMSLKAYDTALDALLHKYQHDTDRSTYEAEVEKIKAQKYQELEVFKLRRDVYAADLSVKTANEAIAECAMHFTDNGAKQRRIASLAAGYDQMAANHLKTASEAFDVALSDLEQALGVEIGSGHITDAHNDAAQQKSEAVRSKLDQYIAVYTHAKTSATAAARRSVAMYHHTNDPIADEAYHGVQNPDSMTESDDLYAEAAKQSESLDKITQMPYDERAAATRAFTTDDEKKELNSRLMAYYNRIEARIAVAHADASCRLENKVQLALSQNKSVKDMRAYITEYAAHTAKAPAALQTAEEANTKATASMHNFTENNERCTKDEFEKSLQLVQVLKNALSTNIAYEAVTEIAATYNKIIKAIVARKHKFRKMYQILKWKIDSKITAKTLTLNECKKLTHVPPEELEAYRAQDRNGPRATRNYTEVAETREIIMHQDEAQTLQYKYVEAGKLERMNDDDRYEYVQAANTQRDANNDQYRDLALRFDQTDQAILTILRGANAHYLDAAAYKKATDLLATFKQQLAERNTLLQPANRSGVMDELHSEPTEEYSDDGGFTYNEDDDDVSTASLRTGRDVLKRAAARPADTGRGAPKKTRAAATAPKPRPRPFVSIGVVVAVTTAGTVTIVVRGPASVASYWHAPALVGGVRLGFRAKDLQPCVCSKADDYVLGVFHGATSGRLDVDAVPVHGVEAHKALPLRLIVAG